MCQGLGSSLVCSSKSESKSKVKHKQAKIPFINSFSFCVCLEVCLVIFDTIHPAMPVMDRWTLHSAVKRLKAARVPAAPWLMSNKEKQCETWCVVVALYSAIVRTLPYRKRFSVFLVCSGPGAVRGLSLDNRGG